MGLLLPNRPMPMHYFNAHLPLAPQGGRAEAWLTAAQLPLPGQQGGAPLSVPLHQFSTAGLLRGPALAHGVLLVHGAVFEGKGVSSINTSINTVVKGMQPYSVLNLDASLSLLLKAALRHMGATAYWLRGTVHGRRTTAGLIQQSHCARPGLLP